MQDSFLWDADKDDKNDKDDDGGDDETLFQSADFFFLTQGPREFITINYSKFSGLGLPLNRTHDIIVHIIIFTHPVLKL